MGRVETVRGRFIPGARPGWRTMTSNCQGMLGGIMMVLALFFSQSVGVLFQIFPKAVLGVILFFAGAELAISTRDIGSKKEEGAGAGLGEDLRSGW